jgi:hypothetical protein
MPTVFRHKPGQMTPLLRLQQTAINAFSSAVLDIRKKALDIRKKCKLTEIEQHYFEVIVDPASTGPTFIDNVEYPDISDLKETLGLMNHLCRIYARAQQTDPPILNPKVPDFNPVCDLVPTRAWPVVEVEIEMLRSESVIGNFEIIDTPGRNETDLVPAIKSVVNSTMDSSAAIVCVLNCTCIGTDETNDVRRELKFAKSLKTPIYALGNKVDIFVKSNTKPGAKKELALRIGQTFLDDGYDEKMHKHAQQVFTVSSQACLGSNCYFVVFLSSSI